MEKMVYGPEDKKKALNTLLAVGATGVPLGFLGTMLYRKNALQDYFLGKAKPQKPAALEIPVFRQDEELDPATGVVDKFAAQTKQALTTDTKLHQSFADAWPTSKYEHPLWSWLGIPALVGTGALSTYLGHNLGQKVVGKLEEDQSESDLELAKSEFRDALQQQLPVKQAEGPTPIPLMEGLAGKAIAGGSTAGGLYLTALLAAMGGGGATGYYYGRKANKYLQLQEALKSRANEMQSRFDPYATIKNYPLPTKKEETPDTSVM